MSQVGSTGQAKKLDKSPMTVHSSKTRAIVGRRRKRRDDGNGDGQRQPQGVPDKGHAFATAAAKAKPTIDAAYKVLLAGITGPEVQKATQPYYDAGLKVKASVDKSDWPKAMTDLQGHEKAAKDVLAAKGRDDAAALKQKQFDTQVAQYESMAPTLTDVKQTYLSEGGAERIGKLKLDKEQEFKDYLAALQTLEGSKKGVNPTQPVDKTKALAIKANCDDVIAKAQAYLQLYATLTDNQKQSKESLSKKRYCEEGMLAARQYGLAMELDALGKPTPNNPWDRETEMKAAGARAAFCYEQGYQQATSLKDGGNAGASASNWIRAKDAAQVAKDLRDGPQKGGQFAFIFKPFNGEDFPDGSSDKKGAGAAKEALACSSAKLVSAQTGIDLNVPPTHVVSVSQHAVDGGDPNGPPLIGSIQQHAGASTQVKDLPRDTFKKIKATEIQKMVLMDMMQLSVDRHGGNIMVDTNDPDNPKLIPIDHGGSLPSRKDFPKLKDRIAGLNPNDWAEASRPTNTLLKMPAAFEGFDPEVLAKLELLDPAAIEADMKQQRQTLDQVHPGLGAGTKVGDDSFHMSKRSMMFLKKAAKVLSPAEVQIALAMHGEQLFDAPDDQFDRVADDVIAEAGPKKGAYQEVLGLSPEESYKLQSWLKTNGWVKGVNSPIGASNFLMSDPQTALRLYKSKTPNPNPPRSPLQDPPPTKGDVPAQTIAAIKQAFPDLKELTDDAQLAVKRKHDAGWQVIVAQGGMNAVTAAVTQIGGKGPKEPPAAAALLTAWAALQTPAYAAELQALPTKKDASKGCMAILKELMQEKAGKILEAQQGAAGKAAAATVDPVQAASRFATDLLAAMKASLTEFEDQTLPPPLEARRLALENRLTQGPGNEPPTKFAEGVEKDVRALDAEVNEAAVADVRAVCTAIGIQLKNINPPTDDAGKKQFEVLLKKVGDITEMTGPNAALKEGRGALQTLKADAAGLLGTATAKATNVADQDEDEDDGDDTGAPSPAALTTFDWTESSATGAKRAAIRTGLFKKQDTGLNAAIKTVKAARAKVDDITQNDLPARKKIAVLEKAAEVYNNFAMFVAGKLRRVSRSPEWSEYCNLAADKVAAELKTINAQIKSLKEAGQDT